MFSHKTIVQYFIIIFAITMFAPRVFARDKIIAIVNDELITKSNLDEYVQSTYAGIIERGFNQEQLEKARIDLEINGIHRLIEDKLILSKANQVGIEINDKLVNERVNEIKARYPDETVFLDALSKSGVSITDLRSKILDQLKIQYIVTHEVRSKIFVNPQEVTDYYTAHLDNYVKKERVLLDSIYISNRANKEIAKTKAQEALNKLKEGADFKETNKEYSDAASIGPVERGQLMKKIEDAVFSLELGRISEIIEVENGFYIFKLNERLPAETAELKEVKDNIDRKSVV